MQPYREYRPTLVLRPYVDCFWTSDIAADGSPLRILPDGSIDFLWSTDDSGVTGKVVGTMTRAALFSPVGLVRITAARFRPGGAAPFLRYPANEVTDHEHPLIEPRLEDGLAAAANGSARVRLLQAHLLARLPEVRTPETRTAQAARLLARGSTVSETAQAVELSRQYLNRLFLRETGISPKLFARVMRLQRLRAVRRTGADWATAALETGYSDQAHLIRECRELTGVRPTHLG